MSNLFFRFPPAAPVADQSLEAYRLTWAFYREVDHRQAVEAYCHWYDLTAAQHRQELQHLRRDINLLGWFNRRR